MDYRTTNKEQVDELKQWWRDYGRWLLIAVVLGLLLGYGWRFWQARGQLKQAEASQLYMRVTVASNQANWSSVDAMRHQLLTAYPQSAYTAMVQLQWADHAFKNKDNAAAQKALMWVRQQRAGTVFADLAQLQSARVAFQAKNNAQALKLSQHVGHGLQPMADQLQAVILQSMGRSKEALARLEQAQLGFAQAGVNQPELAMQLAALPQEPVAAPLSAQAAKVRTRTMPDVKKPALGSKRPLTTKSVVAASAAASAPQPASVKPLKTHAQPTGKPASEGRHAS